MSNLTVVDPSQDDPAPAGLEQGGKSEPPLAVVVEDDCLVRTAVSAYLEVLGCQVMAVGSADDAEALLRSLVRRPRFMICDYGLPNGRNGLQVIATARQLLGETFSAFLLTGLVSRDVSRHCREIGVDLVFKPVSPGVLATIVQRACS